MARPEEPDERRHKVRFGLGAGVDPALRVAFEKRFGLTLVEIYGMSEIGVCSFDTSAERDGQTRSVGRTMPGLDYQIIDDDGVPQPEETPGELRVRRSGPDPRRGLLKEYFRDPETTEAVWKDGWFHTGDILVETQGGLVFVDRKKHMIRRSGQNISAGEVEATLRTHPAVSEVAVIPVADELRDEEVYACVILKADFTAGAELADALARYAVTKLAYFEDSRLGGVRREPADHLFAEAPQGRDIRRSRSSPDPTAVDVRPVKQRRGRDGALTADADH